MSNLITATQFAKALGVSPQTISTLARNKKIKASRMHGNNFWLISPKELEKWENTGKQTHKLKRVKIEKPEAPDPIN